MEPVFPFDLVLPGRGEGHRQALHGQLRAAILDGRLAAGAPLRRRAVSPTALGIAATRWSPPTTCWSPRVTSCRASRARRRLVADIAARARARPRARGRTPEDPRLNPVWRTPFLRPEPRAIRRRAAFASASRDTATSRTMSGGACRRSACARWAKQPFSYRADRRACPPLREAIAQHVAFARAVACTATTSS